MRIETTLGLALILALAPACGSDDHATQGYEALRAGRNDEAIDQLRLAVKQAPDRAELHYDLGIAYENAGWVDAAVPEFERAVALDGKNEEFKAGLAQTKRTLGYRANVEGRNADAVKLYQSVLLLTPMDAITWYNLGISLEKLGRTDEARRARVRAAELDPEHYHAPS